MSRSLVLCLMLTACDGKSDGGADTGVAQDGGSAGDGGGDSGSGEPWEEELTIPAIRVTGAVTWTLTFDEEAQTAGLYDCSYSRSYEGLQDLDLGYLCPDCDVITQGTATMTDGSDCYAQIGDATSTERDEGWGWSEAGTFYRSGLEQYPLGELTTFTPGAEGDDIALAWESENTMTAGGTMILSATGSFQYQTDSSTLLAEPFPDRTAPYACGWPQEDPGDLVQDYELVEGGTFPNVRLVDQCGDKLALWDLYGRWLVMTTSQPDCGPCIQMAAGSDAFVADMEALGVDVMVVDILGNGLSEPNVTPDDATVQDWVDNNGVTDPVLFDRGFGLAMFPTFVEDFSGEDFGYPTWLLVNPEMELVYGNVGFGDWESVGDVIFELGG